MGWEVILEEVATMAYDYKDPREIDIQRIKQERHEMEDARARRVRSRVRMVFARALEIVLVAISYFQSSYIVRFVTTKLSMDVLVEVSVRFGRDTGHLLSTCLATIATEPRLIAVVVAAVLLVIEFFAWIGRSIGRSRRRRRAYRYEYAHRDRDGRLGDAYQIEEKRRDRAHERYSDRDRDLDRELNRKYRRSR